MEKENTGGKREHLSMAKKIPGPKITPMFFDKMLWFMFFLNQLPNSEVFPECLLCVRQRSTCMEAHHETKQAANPDHAKYKFQSLPGMFQAPDWIPNRQKKKKDQHEPCCQCYTNSNTDIPVCIFCMCIFIRVVCMHVCMPVPMCGSCGHACVWTWVWEWHRLPSLVTFRLPYWVRISHCTQSSTSQAGITSQLTVGSLFLSHVLGL